MMGSFVTRGVGGSSGPVAQVAGGAGRRGEGNATGGDLPVPHRTAVLSALKSGHQQPACNHQATVGQGAHSKM